MSATRSSLRPTCSLRPLVDGRPPARFEDAGRLSLAVEVLSPTTARADRVATSTVYREDRVGEYWIIDLDARAIEQSTPGDARAEIIADTLEWHPAGAEAPLVLDVVADFAHVLNA